MSKTKRWIRQIGNLFAVVFILWLALSVMEIGMADCTVVGRDYSPLNLIEILFYIFER
jgi:hypothetical protein